MPEITQAITEQDVRRFIKGLNDLSTIPVLLGKILKIVQDENSSAEELHMLITYDQALEAGPAHGEFRGLRPLRPDQGHSAGDPVPRFQKDQVDSRGHDRHERGPDKGLVHDRKPPDPRYEVGFLASVITGLHSPHEPRRMLPGSTAARYRAGLCSAAWTA